MEEKQEPKRNNWEFIEQDYINEVEATNCTPDEYFRERNPTSAVHKTTMYRHMKKFDAAYEARNRVLGDGAKEQSLLDSLEYYITDNPQ